MPEEICILLTVQPFATQRAHSRNHSQLSTVWAATGPGVQIQKVQMKLQQLSPRSVETYLLLRQVCRQTFNQKTCLFKMAVFKTLFNFLSTPINLNLWQLLPSISVTLTISPLYFNVQWFLRSHSHIMIS